MSFLRSILGRNKPEPSVTSLNQLAELRSNFVYYNPGDSNTPAHVQALGVMKANHERPMEVLSAIQLKRNQAEISTNVGQVPIARLVQH